MNFIELFKEKSELIKESIAASLGKNFNIHVEAGFPKTIVALFVNQDKIELVYEFTVNLAAPKTSYQLSTFYSVEEKPMRATIDSQLIDFIVFSVESAFNDKFEVERPEEVEESEDVDAAKSDEISEVSEVSESNESENSNTNILDAFDLDADLEPQKE